MLALLLLAASDTTLTVQGVAVLGKNPAVARDKAINDALRNAVEEGVGVLVKSESQVENFELVLDKIRTQAKGYVKSYEVVRERKDADAGLYRVWVKATVSLGKLEDDLAAMGILVREIGKPRVAVVLDNEDFRYRMEDYLNKKGFPLVDLETVKKTLQGDELTLLAQGDLSTIKKLGALVGADIVITGKASVKHERKKLPYTKEPKDFYTAKVIAKAVEALTGEIIAVASVERSVPFSRSEAVKRVGDSAAAELASEIVDKWQRRENVIYLVVKGATPKKMGRIRAKLVELVRGVKEAYERGSVAGYGVIEIVAERNPQEVLDDVRAQEKALGIRVESYEGKRIRAVAR